MYSIALLLHYAAHFDGELCLVSKRFSYDKTFLHYYAKYISIININRNIITKKLINIIFAAELTKNILLLKFSYLIIMFS